MNGLIKPVWYYPAKHIYKFLTCKSYRSLSILFSENSGYPRYKDKLIKFDKNQPTFLVPDVASFLSTYEELFVKQIYKFKSVSEKPVIIDMGANIGLSILYFKTLYPEAIVEAYEADAKIFKYLEQNVRGFSNVFLLNNAVWDKNTKLYFDSEGADGGRITDEGTHKKIEVVAVDAKKILDKYDRIDFLKIDIEGAERIVLPRINDLLYKVNTLFIEYHSEMDKEQCLPEILRIIKQSGFRIKIQDIATVDSPFVEKNQGVFDCQLNIFAIRGEVNCDQFSEKNI
ncbi:FkbM family methyltransferase [Succinispira mobilis]|uniref:FkbM family methyltransferase n=1 Tax=Succinispira mobilis TaxID=78120 RepID=UPI00036DF780|nr:FkbM family methyltransferase [Succinispira mobilis]